MRPGQVDVKEEQKGTEAQDRRIELVIVARKAVEEEVPIDLS